MKGKYFTMKTKMVFSEYNPETRMSTVKVANTFGIFTGYAKCHPQDTESSFLGCHLAEYRATIKALQTIKTIDEGCAARGKTKEEILG